MGQDPRDIERQIEETREQMGDTVQALTDKADVPGRVKGYVADKKDAVTSKVQDARSTITGTAAHATGGAADAGSSAADTAKHAVTRGAGMAKDNPIGLALGAVAAGFLVGSALPSTTLEDRKVGPLADQIKGQAMEIGSDALDHGKQLVQEVAEQTADTTKQAAREHAADLQEGIPPLAPPDMA
jgi:hypothetical protein